MIREDIIEKMVFEQRFKGGEGKLLIPYFWEYFICQKGQSQMLTHQKFLPTAITRYVYSPFWALEELCYSLVQSVLRFWFSYSSTCPHSLVCFREPQTNLIRNNPCLINCSTFSTPHNLHHHPTFLYQKLTFSQNPFTLFNQNTSHPST